MASTVQRELSPRIRENGESTAKLFTMGSLFRKRDTAEEQAESNSIFGSKKEQAESDNAPTIGTNSKDEMMREEGLLPELIRGQDFLTWLIMATHSIDDLGDLLRVTMDGAIALAGADRGIIFLREKKSDALVCRVARRSWGRDIPEQDLVYSQTAVEHVLKTGEPKLAHDTSSDPVLKEAGSVCIYDMTSILVVPLRVRETVVGLIYLESRGVPKKKVPSFSNASTPVLLALANQVAAVLERAELRRERARLQRFLQGYVSPQVAQALEDNVDSLALEGREQDVTILFADITGYTPMAESLSPAEVLTILNDHYSRMVAVLFRHGGTVNQFAGDEVMAIFGAPVPQDEHVERAARAALEMKAECQAWQTERTAQGLVNFGLKIGLHCGPVVVGSVGSPERMEYAAIGDVVNIASRVMNLASTFELDTCVLATAEVAERCRGAAQPRELGKEKVKGRKGAVIVCELVEPKVKTSPAYATT